MPSAFALGRRFGRFELKALLGRSERTMLWLALDTRAGHETLLALPRTQPADARALNGWLEEARLVVRLAHPQIASSREVGAQEHWPFIAYDRAQGLTLTEWLAAQGTPAPLEAARFVGAALLGLAFAHEAGVAHHDVQPHFLVVSEAGHVRLLGLGAAQPVAAVDKRAPTSLGRVVSAEADRLRGQRQAAERDVLACGLLLHGLLAGAPPLAEPDFGGVIARIAPLGREILVLPRLTPQPVPEPLRIIVNRATSSQPRLRYRSARALLHAVDGWRRAHESENGGPVAELLDRVATLGHLPALPDVAARAARLALMERGRTHEMAEIILRDMALSFELLRNVNSAQVRGMQVSGSGPVLTVRRSIAMLGLKGVRNAALALRAWPGPLSEAGARDLRALFDRVRLAGHLAQVIRPAGFDAEVIFLVTLLQNLGRLVVQYHFPDEAQQMRALMHPVPADRPGDPDQPGLNEEIAALGVFGVDIEAFASAVARQWGLTDEVLHLIRRLNPAAPVRHADGDDDLIRTTASCANETIDALALPASRQVAAIEHIAQRYARSLKLTLKDLNEALQRARQGGEPLQANEHENDYGETNATIPLADFGADGSAPKPA